MKALPCRSEQCERRRNKATTYPVALLPGREPYTLLSFPRGAEMVYRCDGCKRKTRLSAMEFSRLPDLNLEGLRALAADYVTLDLQGAGLTRAQIDQLGAAMPVAELVGLISEPPRKQGFN